MKLLLARINSYYCRLEIGLLVAVLVTMMAMGVVQILLRNFFDIGLVWNESFLRVLVLWVSLLGTMVATASDEHIRIDLLKRLLPVKLGPWVDRLVSLMAGLICAIAARYTANFFLLEYGEPYPAFANVPVWAVVIIMPVGFMVMAMRFFWQSICPMTTAEQP